MTCQLAIKKSLRDFLASQRVELSRPKECMLELRSVPIGQDFSKPRTNLMLWDKRPWRLFVDDNLDYHGPDAGRQTLLDGPANKCWRQLNPDVPLAGDVNQVLLTALELLGSPLLSMLPELDDPPSAYEVDDGEAETDFDLTEPGWFGQALDVRQFSGRGFEPTAAQTRAIDAILLSVMRQQAPACPVLCGPSGGGKSTAARLAAERMVQEGAAGDVFEISGAALHAGISYEAERDERLTAAFAAAAGGSNPLILFEQFDLLLAASKLVHVLTANAIDRGVRLIGVAQPAFDPHRLRKATPLLRRVKPIGLPGAEPREMPTVIGRRLAGWPLAREVEILPEALAASAALSAQTGAVEPAASVGLLESVLIDARQRGLEIVGPDEVYHTYGRIYD